MGNEKYGGGFILLYRAILEWEWYKDVNTCRLFIHLLLSAVFQPTRVKGQSVKRGQYITSVRKLAQETGLSEANTRTAIKHLESTHEITCTPSRQGTVITIKNYSKYQAQTQRPTHDQHTNPKNQHTTNTPTLLKKEKNKKYIPPESPKGGGGVFEDYAGEDAALLEALRAFDQMRTKIKKPMTDVARKRLTQKLDKLAAEHPGMDKVDVIEEAVLHCWQSVYPPKEQGGSPKEDDGDVL